MDTQQLTQQQIDEVSRLVQAVLGAEAQIDTSRFLARVKVSEDSIEFRSSGTLVARVQPQQHLSKKAQKKARKAAKLAAQKAAEPGFFRFLGQRFMEGYQHG